MDKTMLALVICEGIPLAMALVGLILSRDKTRGLGAFLASLLFRLSRAREKWSQPLNRISTTFIDFSNGFEQRWNNLAKRYRIIKINKARAKKNNQGNKGIFEGGLILGPYSKKKK